MYSGQIEENIIGMIKSIRKDQRKRPSFQEIFEGINKNKDNLNKMDISIFKDSMMKLQSANKIYDGGKGGRESFYVNHDIPQNISSDRIDNLNVDSGIDGEDSQLFDYINDKFYESLKNMIKVEVKSEVKTQLNNNNKHLLNAKHCDTPSIHIPDNEIITTLTSQVEFLKNELLSKEKTIDLLLKDKYAKSNYDKSDNDIPFIYPKKYSKLQNPSDNTFNITTHNGFQLLDSSPLTECNGYNYDERNSDIDTSINNINNKVKSKKYRSTTIIGDSIVKGIKSYEMRKRIPKGDKIYVKSFSGATTECMRDYVKPSLKFNPDLIILHTGVNNIRSNKSPNVIAEDIVNLACDIKNNSNDVVISGLVGRSDNLNFKLQQVNDILISKCTERNLLYIDNSNITHQHLNSTMHLNHNGTCQLASNFLSYINV